MNLDSAVHYMLVFLGPVYEAVNLTEDALIVAAQSAEAAYGAPFAEATDELKLRILLEFYALNMAVSYASPFYDFSAPSTTVSTNHVFVNLHKRWRDAFSVAQRYLADAGLAVAIPGSPAISTNFGWRAGKMRLGYLTDEVSNA